MVKHPSEEEVQCRFESYIFIFFFASLTWPIMKESGIRWVMPGGG